MYISYVGNIVYLHPPLWFSCVSMLNILKQEIFTQQRALFEDMPDTFKYHQQVFLQRNSFSFIDCMSVIYVRYVKCL